MNAKIVHPQEPIDRSILDRTGDDFSIIPEIEICPKVEIDRANGAFASTTNKIYLAQEFLSENADNLKAITSTLLEEIGHSLDWRVNAGDTPVVRGEVLFPRQLQHLKTEDDTATITLDGKVLQIEKADISWIGNSGDWYDSANWSNGIVPEANDDVTIDISAQNITISFSEGEPSVNSLSLFVRNGGILSLPELTSYSGAEGFSWRGNYLGNWRSGFARPQSKWQYQG
jgi:hypothetical protein